MNRIKIEHMANQYENEKSMEGKMMGKKVKRD